MNKTVEDDEVIVEDQATEEQEDQEEASEGSESTEETETDDEVTEIVLEGDDGSQPVDHITQIVRKRVNRLNKKVIKAEDGATQANSELAAEREKNKLLRLALDQQQERQEAKPSTIPDPLDFDGGASDPNYVTAMNAYHQEFVRAALAEQAPQAEAKTDEALVKAQTRHYEAADNLKISDYEAVEDVAVEILGKETVNHLIGQASNSPLILYHLGKNPEKARRIAELVKTNPVKGVMELGALAANLKATKVKRNQAPNPDDVLEGAKSPSKGTRGPKGAVYS